MISRIYSQALARQNSNFQMCRNRQSEKDAEISTLKKEPRSIFAQTLAATKSKTGNGTTGNRLSSDADIAIPVEIKMEQVAKVNIKTNFDKETRDALQSSYSRNVQAKMRETLRLLVEQNQTTRTWFRNNARNNGTMMPSEHHEKIPSGIGLIYIHAGRNNTIVTLTDWNHKIVTLASGGMCGLRGHHRGTSESGTRSGSRLARLAIEKGFRDVFVIFKGFGPGRDAAFRSIMASGLSIRKISDKTPIQHGGCKPKKARRV